MRERVFLTIGLDEQAVEFELTQTVDNMMAILRPWTASMSTMLRGRVRDESIMRAIEVVIQARQERGETTTPWYVRRTPPAPSAAVMAFSC